MNILGFSFAHLSDSNSICPNRPSQNEYRKRAVQVRNGECGVRPNLISDIAQLRAPGRRFGRSAACLKPQHVRTHEPPDNSPRQPPAIRCELGQLALPPIVHPKLDAGKEFPSACIRFPSSPSFVRRASTPRSFRCSGFREKAAI